jgi:hypothetical protein
MRKRSVSSGRLQIAMTEIMRQRPSILALVDMQPAIPEIDLRPFQAA